MKWKVYVIGKNIEFTPKISDAAETLTLEEYSTNSGNEFYS